jgi:hypothetical protein
MSSEERAAQVTQEAFRKSGKLEIPLLGINTSLGIWTIIDVQSGAPLRTINMETTRRILVVLDGENVITDDLSVFSLKKQKDVQDLQEIREFLGGEAYPSSFASLPGPDNYVYVFNEEGHSVFEPGVTTKKLVIHRENTIQVWSWSSGELSKDYTFEFEEEILEKVLPLPKASQIRGENEIGLMLPSSFVVFDVDTQETLVEIDDEGEENHFYFFLPGGKLGMLARREAEEYNYLYDMSELLVPHGTMQKRKSSQGKGVGLFPLAERSLIIKDPDSVNYLWLLWYHSEPWQRGRTDKSLREVKIGGLSVPYTGENDFCSCTFHGSDVGFVSLKRPRQLTFVDLSTGETKQTLRGIRNLRAGGGQHLPGNNYLLGSEAEKVLIRYDERKERYSSGPTLDVDQLLPSSKMQRSALFYQFEELFGKPPIPEDLVAVIFDFI